MSKSVHNTHQAEIIVSLPGGGNLVLQPGDNRLTHEDYRALKQVPVIANYFTHGLLKDVTLAPKSAQSAPVSDDDGNDGGDKDDEKPLDRMNKAELLAKAESLGLTVDPAATNAAIRDAITAAQ